MEGTGEGRWPRRRRRHTRDAQFHRCTIKQSTHICRKGSVIPLPGRGGEFTQPFQHILVRSFLLYSLIGQGVPKKLPPAPARSVHAFSDAPEDNLMSQSRLWWSISGLQDSYQSLFRVPTGAFTKPISQSFSQFPISSAHLAGHALPRGTSGCRH